MNKALLNQQLFIFIKISMNIENWFPKNFIDCLIKKGYQFINDLKKVSMEMYYKII